MAFSRVSIRMPIADKSPLHLQSLVSVRGRCRWARIHPTNPPGRCRRRWPKKNISSGGGICQKKRVTCLGLSRLSRSNRTAFAGSIFFKSELSSPLNHRKPTPASRLSALAKLPLPHSSSSQKVLCHHLSGCLRSQGNSGAGSQQDQIAANGLPLSADRELKTVSLSHVNGNAKVGKTFLSANLP